MVEGKLVDAEFEDERASIELITGTGHHCLEVTIRTRDTMRILDFYDKIKDLVFGNLKR